MSLDLRIRTALHAHLAAWPTGARSVVTYQVGPFALDQMPVLDVEVGGWSQHEVGNGPVGQRVFERTYDVHASVVANCQAADFAEAVNLIGEQVQRALSQFDAIANVNVQGLTLDSQEYLPVNSEEGKGGALRLHYSLVVVVNEARPDVPMGPVAFDSIFPAPAF